MSRRSSAIDISHSVNLRRGSFSRALAMPHIELRNVFLHQLLRDRAAAAQVFPAAEHVGEHGARRADDSRRRDGRRSGDPRSRSTACDHARRDGGERHVAPLLAPLADERGEERRVERDGVERRLAADDLDGLQRAAAGPAVERVRARRLTRLGGGRGVTGANTSRTVLPG